MELVPDWENLSDSLFANVPLLLRAKNTPSFAFFSSVIISGGLKKAVENTLLSSLQMVGNDLANIGDPFTPADIAFINEKLEEWQFTIRL